MVQRRLPIVQPAELAVPATAHPQPRRQRSQEYSAELPLRLSCTRPGTLEACARCGGDAALRQAGDAGQFGDAQFMGFQQQQQAQAAGAGQQAADFGALIEG